MFDKPTAKGKFFAGGAVYPAEVVRERLAVFVAYVLCISACSWPDALYISLISGLRKGRLYGVFDACKAIGADDEDVFDASIPELVQYGQPAPDKAGQALLRAFILACADAVDVPVSAGGYAGNDIRSLPADSDFISRCIADGVDVLPPLLHNLRLEGRVPVLRNVYGDAACAADCFF